MDTATGGQPASPPPPPPTPQGVKKLRTMWGPAHPVELFVAKEMDIHSPTRRLREDEIPPAARVRGTPYPRSSPRSSGSNSPNLSLSVAVPRGTRPVAQQPDADVTGCVKPTATANTPLPSLGARMRDRPILQEPYGWDMTNALTASRAYPGLTADQIHRKYIEHVWRNSYSQMCRGR